MGSETFILRNRALDFEERAEADRLVEPTVNDPEGAAWTIAVLKSLLARNGVRIEVLVSGSDGGSDGA